MKIPVFVSCPNTLTKSQNTSRRLLFRELDGLGLEPRSLGSTDYPKDFPLKEVLQLAKHCSGGVILGFEQFQARAGIWKRGTTQEKKITSPFSFATPWNQLEAGILFCLGLPILVFREESISDGIFDPSNSDVFVHSMPQSSISKTAREALHQVFLRWEADVRAHYYNGRHK